MKLSKRQEAKFREEYGVDRFGKYELVLGLGIDLFEGWRYQELVSHGYLDKIKSVRILRKSGRKVKNGLFEGVKDARKILYLNLPYSASRASTLWEPYFCHGNADRTVAIGWCGDLTGRLNIGSLILPNETVSGEGMTPYYFSDGSIPPKLKKGYVPRPSMEMMNDFSNHLEKNGFKPDVGKVYSIEAFNCETLNMLKELHDRGFSGIDLESSALLAAAEFHKKTVVIGVVVSDKPYSHFHDYVFPRNEITNYFFHRVRDVVRLSTSFLINS